MHKNIYFTCTLLLLLLRQNCLFIIGAKRTIYRDQWSGLPITTLLIGQTPSRDQQSHLPTHLAPSSHNVTTILHGNVLPSSCVEVALSQSTLIHGSDSSMTTNFPKRRCFNFVVVERTCIQGNETSTVQQRDGAACSRVGCQLDGYRGSASGRASEWI